MDTLTLSLPYLGGYPDEVQTQVRGMIAQGRLGAVLRERHPEGHVVRNSAALFDYTVALKNRHMRSAPPLAKVLYDDRLEVLSQALGLHTRVSRLQGGRLKAKREIRVASVFRDAPAGMLRMIVVHELAHLKEAEHDRAFYALCRHMEPDYHQLELDTRLYLTHLALGAALSP